MGLGTSFHRLWFGLVGFGFHSAGFVGFGFDRVFQLKCVLCLNVSHVPLLLRGK